MEGKVLQRIILSKYQNSDMPTEIHRDLNGGIGLRTIKLWCQMIHQSDSIALSTPSGRPRFVGKKGSIQKVKYRLRRKRRAPARKLSMEFGISDRSVRRIMKNDLGRRPYKIAIEVLLSDDQKIE